VAERAEVGGIEIQAEDLDDLDALNAELRGAEGLTVTSVPAPGEPGDQGAVADLLIVALTSGAVTAFLQIVKVLAESRGPGFRLKIRQGRSQIEITTDDPDKGLAALRDLLDGS
jgi:S1-C subfamily serine protease